MILTEEKNYTISLEKEESDSENGLTGNTIELEFSNKELLHEIITCGMPIQRLTVAYPEKKRLEMLYKMFVVERALDTEGDRLKKSQKTAYLDSSEKSVISYYMGMFFTKLISHRLYGDEYLTHLNLIKKMDHSEYNDFFASEWRPEMLGYNPVDGRWSAWEAKGGSNRREQALKKGTQQLEAIGTLNGVKPDPAVVCMTYYDHSYLCGILRQASGKADGEPVQFHTEDYFEAYYHPIRELFFDRESSLRLYDSFAEVTFTIPYFSETQEQTEERRIQIGMSRELLQKLMDADYKVIAEMRKKADKEKCPEGAYMGADGIYIR